METRLHHDLKILYAAGSGLTEVVHDEFRIDAITPDGELIEIQHASLGALRDKTKKLLKHKSKHRVRIVKPIVSRKWIVTVDSETQEPIRRRLSPKRGLVHDVFFDLVHFVNVFPHPRLTLDIVLVDAEEVRIPKAVHRFRRKNYVSLEQQVVSVVNTVSIRTASDLWTLLPPVSLPKKFDTAELGKQIDKPRWFAQKVAYCLKQTGAIKLVGKSGNSQVFSLPRVRKAA